MENEKKIMSEEEFAGKYWDDVNHFVVKTSHGVINTLWADDRCPYCGEFMDGEYACPGCGGT